MLWPKKYSYKEFDTKKTFLRLENSLPPPPHNFSNSPSLETRFNALLVQLYRQGSKKSYFDWSKRSETFLCRYQV